MQKLQDGEISAAYIIRRLHSVYSRFPDEQHWRIVDEVIVGNSCEDNELKRVPGCLVYEFQICVVCSLGHQFPVVELVRIFGFHPEDPGSNPGGETFRAFPQLD